MPKTPLESAIADYDKNFIKKWNKIFSEYNSYSGDDRVWIAGPSAYLLYAAGQHFAVDLQIRRAKDFDALMPALKDNTKKIPFMLITHQHDDHMCIPLMNALKDTDIRWYIPKGCPENLIEESGLRKENIIMVSPGDVFKEGKLTIRAFHSPHVRKGADYEFVQCGYEITSPECRILMPGDVRNYDYNEYPPFEKIDFCFSHVWAGDDALHKENFLPMLDSFARFSSAFNAKKYFLGHLYEVGREEMYMWNYTHAGYAMDRFYEYVPESVVEIARVGCSYSLKTDI